MKRTSVKKHFEKLNVPVKDVIIGAIVLVILISLLVPLIKSIITSSDRNKITKASETVTEAFANEHITTDSINAAKVGNRYYVFYYSGEPAERIKPKYSFYTFPIDDNSFNYFARVGKVTVYLYLETAPSVTESDGIQLYLCRNANDLQLDYDATYFDVVSCFESGTPIYNTQFMQGSVIQLMQENNLTDQQYVYFSDPQEDDNDKYYRYEGSRDRYWIAPNDPKAVFCSSYLVRANLDRKITFQSVSFPLPSNGEIELSDLEIVRLSQNAGPCFFVYYNGQPVLFIKTDYDATFFDEDYLIKHLHFSA